MNKSQLINETRRRPPPNLILPRKCATSILDSSFTPHTTKIAPSVLKIRPTIDNSHLIEIRENLFNGGDIFEVDDADLKPLQIHLREYAEKCAIQKRYSLVDKCNDFIEIVKNEARQRSLPEDKTANKFRVCEESLEKLKQRQADETLRFEQQASEKEAELREQHKQQMREFEDKWDHEMPQKYRKASANLLQMKAIERSALLAGDFEKAKLLDKEIERRTNEERSASQKHYVSDYHTYKALLVAKQKQQYSAMTDRLREERNLLQKRHSHELEVVSKREGCVSVQKSDFLKAREHVQISKGNKFMGQSRQTMVRSDEFDPLLPEIDNISTISKMDDKKSLCSQMSQMTGGRRFVKWNSQGTDNPKFRVTREEKPKRTRRVIKTTKKPDIIRQRDRNQCLNESVATEIDALSNDDTALIPDILREQASIMTDAIFQSENEEEELNLSDQLKALVPDMMSGIFKETCNNVAENDTRQDQIVEDRACPNEDEYGHVESVPEEKPAVSIEDKEMESEEVVGDEKKQVEIETKTEESSPEKIEDVDEKEEVVDTELICHRKSEEETETEDSFEEEEEITNQGERHEALYINEDEQHSSEMQEKTSDEEGIEEHDVKEHEVEEHEVEEHEVEARKEELPAEEESLDHKHTESESSLRNEEEQTEEPERVAMESADEEHWEEQNVVLESHTEQEESPRLEVPLLQESLDVVVEKKEEEKPEIVSLPI